MSNDAPMAGFVVLIVFGGIVGYFVYRKYGKMSRGGMSRHYGFDGSESVKYVWSAEFDTDISVASRVGVAILGLALGGIGTVRRMGVGIAISNTNRLGLVIEGENGQVRRAVFTSKDPVYITVVGDSPSTVQGGSGKIVRLALQDQEALQVRIHDSAVPLLLAWKNSA
jgi:hypothetical protein